MEKCTPQHVCMLELTAKLKPGPLKEKANAMEKATTWVLPAWACWTMLCMDGGQGGKGRDGRQRVRERPVP